MTHRDYRMPCYSTKRVVAGQQISSQFAGLQLQIDNHSVIGIKCISKNCFCQQHSNRLCLYYKGRMRGFVFCRKVQKVPAGVLHRGRQWEEGVQVRSTTCEYSQCTAHAFMADGGVSESACFLFSLSLLFQFIHHNLLFKSTN